MNDRNKCMLELLICALIAGLSGIIILAFYLIIRQFEG